MQHTAADRHRILVLDDSDLVLDVVAMTLEEAGYDVQTISQISELVPACAREQWDLVLADVGLPEISTEALADLLRREIAAPILLFSDRDPREMTPLVARSGARGWVAKAHCTKELLQEIAQQLSR